MSLNRIKIIAATLLFLSMSSCYTFKDASIAPDIKTVSVQYFNNTARIVVPTLSQTVSEKLKNKFIQETRLTVVQSGGDFAFSGSITDYSVVPVTLQGNTTAAAKNRLTISIHVKFVNAKDEKANFEQSFTRFSDFDASVPFTAVENDLIREITDQLVQEIFNKAAINW